MLNVYWSSESTLYSNAKTYEYSTIIFPFKSFKKKSEVQCNDYEEVADSLDVYGSNYCGDDQNPCLTVLYINLNFDFTIELRLLY